MRRLPRRSPGAPAKSRNVAGLKARLSLQPLEERAVPTVYTVNSLADTNTGNGTAGTLRYCLTQANADTAGPHTIDLTGLTGAITLTAPLPTIMQSEVLAGPGAGQLTIDANGMGRVLNVGTSRAFELDGLTLKGGKVTGPGGGIEGSAFGVNLTIKNSVISGCSASTTGGGIQFAAGGRLNVVDSSVVNNTAGGSGGGGGIYFYGAATSYTISNSTIAKNTASSGGGLSFANFSGTAVIKGSTIANNVATTVNTGTTYGGGGIVLRSGTGSVSLDDTIVSGNTAANGNNNFAFPGTVTAKYSALASTAGIGTYVDGGGNVIGGSLNLQPLSGAIPVIALGAGSAAVDVGDPALGGTGSCDQCGTPRPQGAGVDIGALEKLAPPQVTSIVVGDGTAQRSEVRSITVTFNSAVTFTGSPAAAFQLFHEQTNQDIANMQAAVSTDALGRTVVTLTFVTAGNAVNDIDYLSATGGMAASLADGCYQLTILSSAISGPGGSLNGGGAGGNYVSPAEMGPSDTGLHLYRMFGDVNGDGMVDLNDLAALRNAMNSMAGSSAYVACLDANNDGFIDLIDLTAFRNRINCVVYM
jgi:hypothetical protein